MGIYEDLNIKKLINAWGTVTKIGGSKMAPEVLKVMEEASRSYVYLEELQHKAGERIAEIIGVEAAYICSGAAAGVAIATAACMAGEDPVKITLLPDSSTMKNEVLMLKAHRFRYDQGVRLAGGRIIEVGLSDLTLPAQLEDAITDNTAMFLYLAEAEKIRGALPLQEVVGIMRHREVPVLVDAAAELPPLGNLTGYIRQGADLVLFSGGKDIRGPQSSGLILGRRKLIRACAANACPYHSIGRSMKVDKETIAGITKAVELYAHKDFDAEYRRWQETANFFLSSLASIEGLSMRKDFPREPGIQPASIPRVYIELDESSRGMSAPGLKTSLENGSPGIVCGEYQGQIVLNPQMLEEGEAEIIVRRIRETLSE